MEKQSFFMVFAEGQKTPTFKHRDLTVAEHEARRLSEMLNVKTYVLASIKSFKCIKYEIEDCRPEGFELPF